MIEVLVFILGGIGVASMWLSGWYFGRVAGRREVLSHLRKEAGIE